MPATWGSRRVKPYTGHGVAQRAPRAPFMEPVESEDWRTKAECRGAPDPDRWFPNGHESPAYAKRVCGGCPVREQCLSWALETGQDVGVWGGLDEGERRALRAGDVSEAA